MFGLRASAIGRLGQLGRLGPTWAYPTMGQTSRCIAPALSCRADLASVSCHPGGSMASQVSRIDGGPVETAMDVGMFLGWM